jgi:hypothetical protein
MSERDAEVLEILLSQLIENGHIDGVGDEAVAVFIQSNRCKPVYDRRHR